MIPPPEQTPPLPHGPEDVTEGYYALEAQERQEQLSAQVEHRDAAALWYRSLTLYRRGMEGGWHYPSNQGLGVEQTMWGLQLQLVGLGISSAKAGIDLLLAGYYSIAFASIRHMLESFTQCLYVAVRPGEARLWYRQPGGLAAQKDPPRMFDMIAAIKADSSVQNANLVDFTGTVYASWKLMTKGAHPSGQGIAQTIGGGGGQEGKFVYGATYRRDLCLAGFDQGLLPVSFLLPQALTTLRPQSETWMADWERIKRDVSVWRKSVAVEIKAYEERLDGDVEGGPVTPV